MSDVAARLGLEGQLTDDDLVTFLRDRRWYASRPRGVSAVDLVDAVSLPGESHVVMAIVALAFDTGAREMYQLFLAAGAKGEGRDEIAAFDGSVLYEAGEAPDLGRLLTLAPATGTTLRGADGDVELRGIGPRPDGEPELTVEPLGADQSNTSVVVAGARLVKMYRRLEAGLNPELEMLLFLTERDFAHVSHVTGWYSYAGSHLRTTLGLAQQFLPAARDGWSLALDELPVAPDGFLARLEELGAVVGMLHGLLASVTDDPAFAPESPTSATPGLVTATIEEEIDEVFARLPDSEVSAAVAGRADELRELARGIAPALLSGRLIRTHGDLHLGQVLWSEDRWFVTDFEGEPDRSIADRRRKASPLRDVAGMLRSFAYAVETLTRDGHDASSDLEQEARERFLAGYRGTIDPSLVPAEAQQERILDLFELEKALYEVRYELAHRPDWVDVPLAGLVRFLDRAAP